MSKLYNDLAAEWYPLLTPLSEYREEADLYHRIFNDTAVPIQTMLELGSGAGHNAYYLKQWYTMTLTDLSDQMLSISRKLNPACVHHQGDMRSLRLAHTFDAVFIHDAIMYMTSLEDLQKVLETAFVHLKPGGVVLVTPDFVRETFRENTDQGGEDGETRSLRYLEWMSDPDPTDNTVTVDYIYALKVPDGHITTEQDRFLEGLFSTSQWLELLRLVGFTPQALEDPQFDRINFVGKKPA